MENLGKQDENVSYCMDDDIRACCKEILSVCQWTSRFNTVHTHRSSYTSLWGKIETICTWTFSDGRGDFVATGPFLSGPLRQPSDSEFQVATRLSSSCYRGSLGSSWSFKLLPHRALWLRPLFCGLLRSNSQASKALYVLYTTTEDAGRFSTVFMFIFIIQAL